MTTTRSTWTTRRHPGWDLAVVTDGMLLAAVTAVANEQPVSTELTLPDILAAVRADLAADLAD